MGALCSGPGKLESSMAKCWGTSVKMRMDWHLGRNVHTSSSVSHSWGCFWALLVGGQHPLACRRTNVIEMCQYHCLDKWIVMVNIHIRDPGFIFLLTSQISQSMLLISVSNRCRSLPLACKIHQHQVKLPFDLLRVTIHYLKITVNWWAFNAKYCVIFWDNDRF